MPNVIAYAAISIGGPLAIAGYAYLIGSAYEQNRRARSAAKAAYNASLEDRLESRERDPDAPRTLCLGRVRTVEGARHMFSVGTHKEKLVQIISFAGERIDGFEAFYFDDVALTLDGGGYVQTEPYFKARHESRSSGPQGLSGGAGAVTLPYVPIAGTVAAAWVRGAGDNSDEGPLSFTLSGSTVSVSGGPADAGQFVVLYQTLEGQPTARIRAPYLGAASQNLFSDLNAEFPGELRSTDRFAGMALAVVELNFDGDVYPQGRPKVTARLRGSPCYDPRKDSTVAGGSGAHRFADPATWEFTENPALHALRYFTWEYGWARPLAEASLPDIMSAADVCDITTVFTLRKADGSISTVTLPRYRCGIVIPSNGDKRQAMDSIVEAMAGRDGWDGGVWRVKAGHMPAPAFTLAPGWLANAVAEDGQPSDEPTLQFTNGVARDQKVNRVSGKCFDPDQRWQLLPFPAYEDAVLVAAEGETFEQEMQLAGVNHVAHAQHLASVAIRRAQAPLTVQAQCNLNAYLLQLFDVGQLSLPRYLAPGKTVEVTRRRWSPREGIQLRLSEITEEIFEPVAELVGRDPAPNSTLPRLTTVERLAGLAIAVGISALADGSIVVRARPSWTGATSQRVLAGGRVQVEFAEMVLGAISGPWALWEEPGAATQATIAGLRSGRIYVWRARFVTAPPFAVAGDWSVQVPQQMPVAPLVTTGGLAGGAATEVVTNAPAAGSLTRTRPGVGLPPAHVRAAIAEAFWVNTTGEAVVVELVATVLVANPDNTMGTVRINADYSPFSSLAGTTMDGDATAGAVTVSAAAWVNFSRAASVSVAAGQTIWWCIFFDLYANAGATVQGDYRDACARITAIKR